MTDEHMDKDTTGQPERVGEGQAVKKRKAAESSVDMPPKPKKVYGKRALVWVHFLQRDGDKTIAYCKYCTEAIGCCSKTVGTSPMIAHVGRCKKYKDWLDNEKQLLSSDDSGNMRMVKYDPVLFRRSVNELVVVNELPLSFVESEGWKRFVATILPLYKTFSRRTSSQEIVDMYKQEMASLKQLFSVEKQRVSLTTDIWTCQTTSYNYMVITGHWINTSWKMQKRILSFKIVTDHKGDTIAKQLLECLEEWGIEKIFTLTVDNANNNDKALKSFRDEFSLKGVESLVRGGEHLHMRCCAHILNLIVGDGLKKSNASVVAVRNAVKYVRSSFVRVKSFAMRCETGKVTRGCLPMDVVTRWNSTYMMLTSAMKLRVAFEKMVSEDKLFCEYFLEEDEKTELKRVGPPTDYDWEEVARLSKFLKIFYKATLTFSASTSVTSTLCYNEIVNVERALIGKCGSPDVDIRKQAHVMRDKFEKYWDGLRNMNPLVIMASVFDPRNKMKFAGACFDQLYGKDTVESKLLHASISSAMKLMYEEYSSRLSIPLEITTTTESDVCMFELSDDEDDCEGMESIYSKMIDEKGCEDGSSELQIYLTEKTELKVENRLGLPYDVLSWWRCNAAKFPILSEFARDILAVQASSVASESVFSTSGRILDPCRSSLTPYMVEVLLCTQQWLRCTFKTEAQAANMVQMLEEAAFFESLDSKNATLAPPSS